MIRRDSIRDSNWLHKASTALAVAAIPAALAFTALGMEDGKREVYFAENSEHYFLSTEEWQSYIAEYQEAHAEEAEEAEKVLASMKKVEAEEERKAEEYHEDHYVLKDSGKKTIDGRACVVVELNGEVEVNGINVRARAGRGNDNE